MGGTPIPREVNINSLKFISQILNAEKIPYSIAFGTLLGYVRERNIIEYDDDIDIWIDIKYLEKVWGIFRAKGMLRNGRGDPFIQLYLPHKKITGIIDIYLYRETEKHIIDQWNFTGHFKNASNHIHIPKEFFFPLQEIDFCECKVFAPAQPENLIKWLYGPRWYEPLKKYKNEYSIKIVNNVPQFTYNVPENIWNSIYESSSLPEEPSSFAKFVLEQVNPNPNPNLNPNLLEIACGNARDSFYFSENGFNVTSVDLSSYIIIKNKLKYPKINFQQGNYDCVKDKLFNILYARFFLHTISEEDETKFLMYAYSSLSPNGILCIETRSVKDKLFGHGTAGKFKNEFINGHYRRFIELNELKNKLLNNGFLIEYEKEEGDISVVENDNPVLIRIVARKKV